MPVLLEDVDRQVRILRAKEPKMNRTLRVSIGNLWVEVPTNSQHFTVDATDEVLTVTDRDGNTMIARVNRPATIAAPSLDPEAVIAAIREYVRKNGRLGF